MIFWFIITSVTLITLIVSLWPIWAKGLDFTNKRNDKTKLYINRLNELENELEDGLIVEGKNKFTSAEIMMSLSDNLLVNNQGKQKTSNIRYIALALIIVFVIACTTWSLYFNYGSPELSRKSRTHHTNEIIHPQKILMAALRAQKKGDLELALVYFQQLKNVSPKNSKAYELINKAIDKTLLKND